MAQLTGRHVVAVHGWSDQWGSMKTALDEPLRGEGARVHYVNYDSREDKAYYEDFAEGLDRELTRLEQAGELLGDDGRLHFVTHSTGALVVRQWLRQYPARRALVGCIVFLAPPNFGSPLASQGKSLIGRFFKGEGGEERFEVGQRILDGLELASPLAWDLAAHDLFGPAGTLFHGDGIRAAVITGASGYGGLRYLVNQPGTDGTIVVAGANLNARKLDLDFVRTRGPDSSKWSGFSVNEEVEPGVTAADVPFAVHRKLNHATVLKLGSNATLRNHVIRALATDTHEAYGKLIADFKKYTARQVAEREDLRYQQLVFRMRDDRGFAITDYHLAFQVWKASKLISPRDGGPRRIRRGAGMNREEQRRTGELEKCLEANRHVHSKEPSLRRYLVMPAQIKAIVGDDHVLTISITAEAGDPDIWYRTDALQDILLYHPKPDFPVHIHPFYENTTTLVDIHLDRETGLVRVGRRPGDFDA